MQKIIDKKLLIRRIFVIVCDIVIIMMSSGMGLLLRYDLVPSSIEQRFIESIWSYFPINLILTIFIYYLFKLYHSLWIFAGVTEMQNVFSACVVSSIVQFVGMQLFHYPVPRSYYFLYGGVLLLLTMGSSNNTPP